MPEQQQVTLGGNEMADPDIDDDTKDICLDGNEYYVASVKLKISEGSNDYYCVDYTGKNEAITIDQHGDIDTDTYCP
jgi:hypothetical protein